MTKGSLVVFELMHDALPSQSVPGIIIKGPYGCLLSDKETRMAHETKVADVLFGARLIRKIPIQSLRVVK